MATEDSLKWRIITLKRLTVRVLEKKHNLTNSHFSYKHQIQRKVCDIEYYEIVDVDVGKKIQTEREK